MGSGGNICNQRHHGWGKTSQSKSEEEVEEIRAAMYNGGPGKYVPEEGSISGRVQETVDFVRKFRLIRDLQLFE